MGFHFGAWRALKESNYLSKITSIGGGSSGCFSAFLFAADNNMDVLETKIDEYALMYPGILCWGKMSNIVGKAIDELIIHNSDAWKYQPYAVITTIQKDLPPIGPRFIFSPLRENGEEVKSLILSSCYFPIMYENAPKWKNKFVLDGGTFLMNLTIPNTLTVSPYMKSDKNAIGYEEGSDEEKILNERKLGSLLPDKDHLVAIRDCGYSSAKKWLEKYNKEI